MPLDSDSVKPHESLIFFMKGHTLEEAFSSMMTFQNHVSTETATRTYERVS